MDLVTPYVRIEVPRVRANIQRLAESAAQRGVAVRPHAKTHKLVPIARLQEEAGAQGLTVATLGEAKVFAAAGFKDLFIAFPLWPSAAVKKHVAALIAAGVVLRIGVDSAEAAAAWDVPGLELMLELDSGHHRSGCLPAGVVDVARAAAVPVAGLFTFPGHSYAPGGANKAAEDELAVLTEARDLLEEAGFEGLVLSGGSTPSAFEASDQLDEMRPGVYPFYDAQQMELGRCREEDVALTVVATVVSRREDMGTFILDVGSKLLGSDKPAWLEGFARIKGVPDARVVALSEHHATVSVQGALPELGAELEVPLRPPRGPAQ